MFAEERNQLLEDVQTSEEELREAVGQLASIARRHFSLGALIGEYPLPWIVGGLVLGFWLGFASAPTRIGGSR